MGAYLVTGIVKNIGIRKKEVAGQVTVEAIKAALQEKVSLNHYDYREDQNAMYWEIKSNMLEGNFLEFYEAQCNIYDKSGKTWQEGFNQITNAKTGKARLTLAESKNLGHFKLIENIYDRLKIEQENGFTTNVNITYDLIAFFVDGKIMMECYNNILNYFTKVIRLQNTQYQASQCLAVMITS